MSTVNSARRTGCYDLAGDEIFIGDIVLVKSERTSLHIVIAVAQPRSDGIEGFQVRYGGCYLEWAASDHDSCYEVMRIGAYHEEI